MWKNIVVKNFRCFSGLLLNPLDRVNLIAGKNNTGKTALLEAIHLHCHPNDCELPIDIHEKRNIEKPGAATDDLCRWLFYDKNPAMGIEVISQDQKGPTRTLTIQYVDAITSRERFPDVEKLIKQSFSSDIASANRPRLILTYEERGERYVSVGIRGAGLSSPSISARVPWQIPSVFLSSSKLCSEEDNQYFSELEAANRQGEVVESLTILDNRLQRLSLLLLGNRPMVHGDIGLSRLVPLPLMGEGMRRLFSIVLAIINSRDGVVLIDEIENGLHHSALVGVWQAIAHAAEKANVQVFATTHSYECITAAHQAFLARPSYDLRLHRLDRLDGEIRVVTYDKETLEAAVELFMEVR